MKMTKLDNRYKAKSKWGYSYSVTFRSYDWKKYFAFKTVAHNMFGASRDISQRFMFRDDVATLKEAVWAYRYIRSRDDSTVYFRNEDQMNQVVMMYALTNA